MKHILVLIIFLASMPSFAQAPVIRAHLEPSKNIMVGQPVRLVVSVFVPNYFTGSPEFPEFEMDNAIVVLPQDRPENSNTQIGSATYYGITQTYVIYPQQAGDFRVPPAKLAVPYAIAPPKSTTADVSLPPLSFHADIPVAARDLPYFLPTTQLTITQRWSRPLKDLRTGDTVERTITVTASKVQAMLIPPLKLEQPDGIRIYSGEPTVRDQKSSRGDFIYGQRIQTAKYFIEKPGDYVLPLIELQWWNLGTRRLVTNRLPEVKFNASKNPDFSAELPPPAEPVSALPALKQNPWPRRRALATGFAKIALVLVLLYLIARLLHQLYNYGKLRTQLHRRSEKGVFRALVHAARSNDAKATYEMLLHWKALVFPDLSIDEVSSLSHDSNFKREFYSLTSALFASDSQDSEEWNSKQFVTELKSLRSRTKIKPATRANTLVQLNP